MKQTRGPLRLGTSFAWALAKSIPLLATAPLFFGCTSSSTSVSDGGDNSDAASSAEGMLVAAPLLTPELLGRPTANAIALNVIPSESIEAYAEFGQSAGSYPERTTAALYPASKPFVITIEGLNPDSGYFYRLRWRRPGDVGWNWQEERSFHTQRRGGSTFRFTIQADSHLDENSLFEMYQRTLSNVKADAPDFHIDLGDTFMCEKHIQPFDPVILTAPDYATVDKRYLFERGNFGVITPWVPLFLVNGNHEGELGYLFKGTGQDIATWATQARLKYYLNPTPNGFYSGIADAFPVVGQRASYYSWTWGDALFVVLDPFWNTTVRSNTDGWVWTLGTTQYQWLAQTLSGSTAKFKFVFLHNLVGGLDGQMRGGVEAAPYFEWGGKNADGTGGFAAKRPGFPKPIHQLLVDNKVTAVFHGHDHVYVKQDLDGIVYQEVPQPSAKNTSSGAMLAANYHYTSGTILSSAGHIRVTVSPTQVTSEYVRAWLPQMETATVKNGRIDDTWTALPK